MKCEDEEEFHAEGVVVPLEVLPLVDVPIWSIRVDARALGAGWRLGATHRRTKGLGIDEGGERLLLLRRPGYARSC